VSLGMFSRASTGHHPIVAFLIESIGHLLGCSGRHALLYQWTNIKKCCELVVEYSLWWTRGGLAGTVGTINAMTLHFICYSFTAIILVLLHHTKCPWYR
jgi:hypothetical protein